jgi:hypothetical protein
MIKNTLFSISEPSSGGNDLEIQYYMKYDHKYITAGEWI